MTTDDRAFPAALADVADVEFPYDEDGDMDYEPYRAFMSAQETAQWLRAWTGNGDVDGLQFRVFGMDGTGGQAAFWLIRPGAPLAEQPVVFLGSEGDRGVVARDLGDYLWLLADGVGPFEAVDQEEPTGRPHERMREIAERHAPGRQRSAAAIIAAAAEEFPDFDDVITAMCR